jgi:hypothetical protein
MEKEMSEAERRAFALYEEGKALHEAANSSAALEKYEQSYDLVRVELGERAVATVCVLSPWQSSGAIQKHSPAAKRCWSDTPRCMV